MWRDILLPAEQLLEKAALPWRGDTCILRAALVLREREQVVSVGNDTVKVPLIVGECSYYGEWLLDDEAAQRVYDGAEKLRHGAEGLTPAGVSYRYL